MPSANHCCRVWVGQRLVSPASPAPLPRVEARRWGKVQDQEGRRCPLVRAATFLLLPCGTRGRGASAAQVPPKQTPHLSAGSHHLHTIAKAWKKVFAYTRKMRSQGQHQKWGNVFQIIPEQTEVGREAQCLPGLRFSPPDLLRDSGAFLRGSSRDGVY